MRALTALVIFMGVLIVAGMAVIVVTLVHRGGASAVTVADLTLAQPAGTHIASIASACMGSTSSRRFTSSRAEKPSVPLH